MNAPGDSRISCRDGRKAFLFVVALLALGGIAALLSGCGSAKKARNSGTEIAYVKTKPSGHALVPGETNRVSVAMNLAFVVGVKDAGTDPEQKIKVTLQILQDPRIVMSRTIRQVRSGGTAWVTFSNFSLSSSLLTHPVEINVDVAPVPDEKNLTNNKASYKVQFSYA